MPGEIFGATVRSAAARGRLRDVRFDPTFDWRDVTIVTAADVLVNVVALIAEDQPVLARDHINHTYEPVVLLGCADRQKLARARCAVTLDVEPLPAIFDMSEALAGRVVIAGEDNIQKRYRITKGQADAESPDGSRAAIDAAIAACDVVVSGRYSTHHQE